MNYSGTPLMRTPTGRQKVSLLERCPQFRGVLIEGFHCNRSPLGPVVLRVVCCSPPCVQLVSEWSVCEVCLSKHSPVMFAQRSKQKVQQIYIRSSVQNYYVQHVTQTHSPSRLYTNQLSYHNCPISRASSIIYGRIPHITGCLRQLFTIPTQKYCILLSRSDSMLPSGAPGSPLPTPYCWEYEIFIDSTRSLLNDNQQEVCHAVGLAISPGIL